MKNDLIEKQRYRKKDCSISHGTGLFSPSRSRIGSLPYVLPGWLVDAYPPGVVYWKTLSLYGNANLLEILTSLNTL